MKAYLNSVFFTLSLLISCGGSKSDVNDSILSGNVNQTSNLNQGSTNNQGSINNQGNTSSNQTNTSYSFSNELVWSDEFDENSLSGAPRGPLLLWW